MDRNNSAQKPLVASQKISQNPENMNSIFTKNLFIFLVIAVILGGMTGFILSSNKGGSGSNNTLASGSVDPSKVSKGTIVGSGDTKIFKDTATGALKNGGINGEGQFHLVRTGGDSQNVYLTSASVDLSQFVDKQIKVWGQTQTAQYAGWLMDVGRIEVLQ